VVNRKQEHKECLKPLSLFLHLLIQSFHQFNEDFVPIKAAESDL